MRVDTSDGRSQQARTRRRWVTAATSALSLAMIACQTAPADGIGRELAHSAAAAPVAAGSATAVFNEGLTALRDAAGVAPLDASGFLAGVAAARAEQACALGAITPNEALEAYLGDRLGGSWEAASELHELVGVAALPTGGPPASRVARARKVVGDQWTAAHGADLLIDPRWDSLGVGDVVCDDGTLRVVAVLRRSPPDFEAPGALDLRATACPAGTALPGQPNVCAVDGWIYRRWENRAYPCSMGEGFQSFVLGHRATDDLSDARPLWVRMRGGGAGYFDGDGVAQPSGECPPGLACSPNPHDAFKRAQGFNGQLGYLDAGGLTGRVLANESARFRVLLVSMCNHDIYAGNDNLDPYNPYPAPGVDPGPSARRRTNGLLATKAAIQHALATYPVDKVFLHGTSAGGYGVYHVAWALERMWAHNPPGQTRLAGIVSDGGVLNLAWLHTVAALNAANGLGTNPACTKNDETRGLGLLARIDATVLDPANQPHLLIGSGALRVPVMHVWNRGDHALCGTTTIACPIPAGSYQPGGVAAADSVVPGMFVAECQHELVRRAIASLGPGSRSRALGLCVEGPPKPGAEVCGRHVVTRANALTTDGVDYNGEILAWVLERLADAD